MSYVVDELQKSLRYHLRQLEENLNKMRLIEEQSEDLKMRNERHRQAITEIGGHIESIEKGLLSGNSTSPVETNSDSIINEV